MPDKLILIAPFIFGAVIGSFLNVCIYRLPLGLSIVSPASRCPACGARVPFYYNIPVISYFWLGGRCAYCKTPLSFLYPFVEALTGAFCAALFVKFGLTPSFGAYFAFVSALIVITFIDLEHRIIPDVISLPGIAAGILASFFLPYPGVVNSVIGAIAGVGLLLGVATAYFYLSASEGMGGGDVKLLGMIGAFLGWRGVLVTILTGSFLGAVVGVIMISLYGKTSKYALPFGPFLALGAVIYLFYGDVLIGWYIVRMVGA